MSTLPKTFDLQQQGDVAVIRFRDSRLLGPEQITPIDRELSAWLVAHPAARVVFDFSAVNAISSDFLSRLIGWHNLVQKGQGRLKVCGLGASLRELFEVTRLSKKFELAADATAAIASF